LAQFENKYCSFSSRKLRSLFLIFLIIRGIPPFFIFFLKSIFFFFSYFRWGDFAIFWLRLVIICYIFRFLSIFLIRFRSSNYFRSFSNLGDWEFLIVNNSFYNITRLIIITLFFTIFFCLII
jgi:hypothetical protein